MRQTVSFASQRREKSARSKIALPEGAQENLKSRPLVFKTRPPPDFLSAVGGDPLLYLCNSFPEESPYLTRASP